MKLSESKLGSNQR